MLLAKIRLSTTVVVSAAAGYGIAVTSGDTPIYWDNFLILIIGGFLVTAAANGFNQIIERDLDAKMERTADRPLAAGRMSVTEALIACVVMTVVGLLALYFLNKLSVILGVVSLLIYVVLYTPLKRITPWAVFVGAFPGAIPPMLGWVAYTGSFGLEPGVLFAIQFIWQFPHFWAIAWVLDDDYKKAGFRLLPTGKRDKGSAFQTLLYALFLIPAGMLPYLFNITGVAALTITMISSIAFSYLALRFYLTLEMKDASRWMFASFIYLPLILLAQLLG